MQDGLLAVEGSLGEERHCVGSTVFIVLNIHQKTLLEVFEILSLEVSKWETTVIHPLSHITEKKTID